MSMDEQMALGRQVYERACVACHQAGGEGLPGHGEVMDALVAQRQAALKTSPEAQAWDEHMETVLMSPAERFGIRIDVPEGTRW